MTGLDLHLLTSGDAVAALRSYPRRYREMLAPLPQDAEPIDALAARVDSTGRSSLDLLTDTVRSLGLIGQALHRTVVEDQPVVHEGAVDPAARHWEHAARSSVPDALAELDDEVGDLVAAVERVTGKDWNRTATVAGGGRTVAAIDLLREAVRTASDNLRDLERTLAAVRRPA